MNKVGMILITISLGCCMVVLVTVFATICSHHGLGEKIVGAVAIGGVISLFTALGTALWSR